MVSHPDTQVLKIYNGSRIADLWDDDKGAGIADLVLKYDDPLAMFLDFAAARALGAMSNPT